jgi:hypothetical protein
VVDDGELCDFQIVLTLRILFQSNEALLIDINPKNAHEIIRAIWQENIDARVVN